MKHVSKLTLILMLLLLLTTPIFASQIQVIDFAQAIELVLSNNLDLKIAALTLANSQIDLEKSKLMSGAETRSQQLNLTLDLAKNQDTYANTRFNLFLSLLTDFTELTKKRQTIETNEIALKMKELDLRLTSDQYAKGSATNISLKNARIAVEDQKLTLQKSKEEYTRLIQNLKLKTGLDGEVQFKELTLNLAPFGLPLEQALDQAIEASYNLKDREIRKQLATLEVEKGELEKIAQLEMKKLLNNQEIAQYRYLLARNEVIQDVKDQIWNLEQILTTRELKKTELEVARENYQQMLAGYKKGYYTEKELLQSQNSLLAAEKALYTSTVDYTLKLAQLQHLLGDESAIGGDIK